MKKSKQEIITTIQKADALECYTEEIDRTASDQSKSQKLKSFTNLASEYLKDQRDLILIVIKIR
jgi:hypothetical protein